MLGELGSQAYGALRHNKRRSILTMLGMAWGIATVVLLLAYGTGFERGLWMAFRSFGTNLVFLFPGRTSLQAGGTKAGSQVRLTINDLDYIRAEVPLLKRLSPEVFKQSTVAWGTRSASYAVSGVYAVYPRMRRMEFAEGAPFGEAEDFTHAASGLHRSGRQEETLLRAERDRRKHPRGRDLLPDCGHSEARHQQQ